MFQTMILDARGKHEDYEDQDKDDRSPSWDEAVMMASPDNRLAVETLISKIRTEFDCVDEKHKKYCRLYTKNPPIAKHRFAIVWCGKNIARIAFRIDPDLFADDGKSTVADWFFKGKERRMYVKAESVDEIIRALGHAYKVTES